MVAPIENYADVAGRVAGIHPHPALSGFVIIDIEVAEVAPVVSSAGGEPYPNWYADAVGSVVSASVREDAPNVDALTTGRTIRCRIRGGGPGVTFIQPDSLEVDLT